MKLALGRFPPGAFVLLLVIAEGLDQSTQHFGGGFEHRLELGPIDLLNVFAEMGFYIL